MAVDDEIQSLKRRSCQLTLIPSLLQPIS